MKITFEIYIYLQIAVQKLKQHIIMSIEKYIPGLYPFWDDGDFDAVWKDPKGIWTHGFKIMDIVFFKASDTANCPHQIGQWISKESYFKDLRIECA